MELSYSRPATKSYCAVARHFLTYLEERAVAINAVTPEHVGAYLRARLLGYRRQHGRRTGESERLVLASDVANSGALASGARTMATTQHDRFAFGLSSQSTGWGGSYQGDGSALQFK